MRASPSTSLLRFAALLLLCAVSGWVAAGFLVKPSPEATSRGGTGKAGRVRAAAPGPLNSPKPRTAARIAAIHQAGSPAAQMAAVLSFAQISSGGEIRALLDDLQNLPAHSVKSQAAAVLLSRWLELDAEAALEHCRAHRAEDYPLLLADYAAEHPDEAFARLAAVPEGNNNERRTALLGICEAQAERNPEKAWEMLGRLQGAGADVERIISKLAAGDVESLLARIDTLPPVLVSSARRAAAELLMKQDPARAWEWAQRQPKPHEVMFAALKTVYEDSPAQALEMLASLPESQRNNIGLPRQFRNAEKTEEFLSALEGTTGLTAKHKADLARNAFYGMQHKDPAGAARLLALMTEETRKGYLPGLVGQWRKKDPEAAERWLAGLSPAEREIASTAPAEWISPKPANLTAADSPSAFAEAAKSGLHLNDSLLSGISLEHFKAALQGESERVSNSPFGGDLTNQIKKANPQVFGEWLAQGGDGKNTERTGAEFSARWAHEAPQEAAEWVSKLPPGELLTNAAGNVARQYAQYDREAAAIWAHSLRDSAARTAALAELNGE